MRDIFLSYGREDFLLQVILCWGDYAVTDFVIDTGFA
jgi:hypothetical protein